VQHRIATRGETVADFFQLGVGNLTQRG
jgi:hypothetical protein